MSQKGNRPGWYPNPHGPGQRWWNGLSWSDAYHSDYGKPMSPAMAGVTGAIVHTGHQPRHAARGTRARATSVGTLLLLLAVAGSLALALIFWNMRDDLAVPSGYETTTGVVERVDMRGSTCHDVVRYTVGGVERTVTDSVGAPSCTPLGLGVDVAYDPADPAQARIPHPTGAAILTVLAVLPLVVAGVMGLLLVRRLARPSR